MNNLKKPQKLKTLKKLKMVKKLRQLKKLKKLKKLIAICLEIRKNHIRFRSIGGLARVRDDARQVQRTPLALIKAVPAGALLPWGTPNRSEIMKS